MAYVDYYHCDLCDAKAFYDADVDYDGTGVGVGHMMVICKDCAKTHEVVVREKPDALP